LAKLDSVAARTIQKSGAPMAGNEPVSPTFVKKLGFIVPHGRVKIPSFS